MTDKEPSPSEKVWGSRGTTAKAEQENAARVALLDEEGELTDGFVRALAQTFVRFSSQAKSDGKAAASETGKADDTERLAKMVLSEAELDEFARSVNGGAVMSTEEKEEVRQYFDVDQTGNLTFTGFCEMYHLQSGSSEEETWKDLYALGYNDRLEQIRGRDPTDK